MKLRWFKRICMTPEKWQQRLPSGLYTYVHTHSYKSSHTCVPTHTRSNNIIIYQISYLLKDIIQIKSTLLQVDLWHWCDVNITYMWVLSSQMVCWTTNISHYCMSINNTNKRNNIRKERRKICHQGWRHWYFFLCPLPSWHLTSDSDCYYDDKNIAQDLTVPFPNSGWNVIAFMMELRNTTFRRWIWSRGHSTQEQINGMTAWETKLRQGCLVIKPCFHLLALLPC